MTGRDPSHGSLGFHQLKFTIQEISGGYALGVDQFQVTRKIPTGVQRAKGASPSVGEEWMITKDLGPWTFAAILANPAQGAESTVSVATGGFADAGFPTGTTQEAVINIDNPGSYGVPGLVSGSFTGGYSGSPSLEEVVEDGSTPTGVNEGGLGYASVYLDSSNRVVSGAWEYVDSFYNGSVGDIYEPRAKRALQANAQIEGSVNFVEPQVVDVMQAYARDETAGHFGLASSEIILDGYWDKTSPNGEADFSRNVYVAGWTSGEGNASITEYLQSTATGASATTAYAEWAVQAGFIEGESTSQQYVAASLYPNTEPSWFVLGQLPSGVPSHEDNYILGQPSVSLLMESNDAALFVTGQDASSIEYLSSSYNRPGVYRGAVSGKPGSGSHTASNMPMYPGSVYPDLTDGAQGLWVVDTTETPAFVGAGYYGITSGSPGTTPPFGSMMSDEDGSLWVYGSDTTWHHIT